MATRRRRPQLNWRLAALYGLALAAGAFALDWLDYQRLARSRTADLYVVLVAAGFLGVGMVAGACLFGRAARPREEGNPAAQASLGISAAELKVLLCLASGLSNREIADALHISPHTVKTHVGRLYEKLGARRRTDAVARARDLGLVP